MTAEVAILVPVLRRPHRAQPLVDSITEATPQPHRILFLCSPDDEEEIEACRKTGADVLTMHWCPGRADWARKINQGYRHTTEPLMLLGADDLRFHAGWLEAVQRKLEPRIGVVGTNDMGNARVMAGLTATHPVVTRRYADEQGTVDGPGAVVVELYAHCFVDTEFCETARRRGAWEFAPDALVEHLHPNWDKAEDDEVYRLGRTSFDQDRALYMRRRRRWM